MKQLDLSIEILKEVLKEKKTFASALKDKFQANVEIRPLRADVAGLVGCELRHHLLFQYLCKDLPGYEPKDVYALSLVLANDYFYRHFPAEEMYEAAKELLSEEQLAAAKPLFDIIALPEQYIPTSIPRSSNLFLSLRYNTPEWVLKIFQHFGHGDCYKILRKYSRPETTTVRVCTSKLTVEKLLENADFTPSGVDGILLYHGKTPLRKLPEFAEGKIFIEKPLTKALIDETLVQEPAEVLLYNGNADCSLEKELIETYGASIGLNIATPETDNKVEVSRLIKARNLHNINFFSAPDPLSMDAAISRPQDLVIAAPNSTNFDLIPTAPDYLLSYDRDQMDAIFEMEQKVLEGASKHVDVGGKLVYLIYTISKKEGPKRISEFLKIHPEFVLEKETQYMPFQEMMTSAYVAILRKEEKELTIAPPIADLSALTPKPGATNQASGCEASGE